MIARAVVAHSTRLQRAELLADRIGAELFVDDGSLGEWENHARALEWAHEHGDHAVIVQDDALPLQTFPGCTERLVALRPDDMIGLYVGKQRPRATQVTEAVAKADGVGAGWLAADRLLWGVATLLPTGHIPQLVNRTVKESYDIWLGRAWVRLTGRPVLYCWPSLVDHDDGPSVIAGRSDREPGRVAHRVGEPNQSDVSVWIT